MVVRIINSSDNVLRRSSVDAITLKERESDLPLYPRRCMPGRLRQTSPEQEQNVNILVNSRMIASLDQKSSQQKLTGGHIILTHQCFRPCPKPWSPSTVLSPLDFLPNLCHTFSQEFLYRRPRLLTFWRFSSEADVETCFGCSASRELMEQLLRLMSPIGARRCERSADCQCPDDPSHSGQ